MKSGSQPLHALTGLRWLAALAVFAHHAIYYFEMPRTEMWLGSLAVSFFFVLSGFILTYAYEDRLKTWRDGVTKFWFARWARIWPLHVVCLAILSILAFFSDQVNVVGSVNRAGGILVTNLLLLQSWVPAATWAFSFNAVSWSISTEAFFYFVFPLLLIGGERQFWWKFGATAFVVVWLVFGLEYLSGLPEYSAKYDFEKVFITNPLLRLPEFCVGMGVGFLFLRRNQLARKSRFLRDTAIEAFVLICFFGYDWGIRASDVSASLAGTDGASGGFSQWATTILFVWVFALMIFVFGSTRGLIGRALGCRLMVFLGEISFAFYLIHQVVLRYFVFHLFPETTLSRIGLSICACAVSLGLAILLYKLVEMPAKKGLLAFWDRKWSTLAALTGESLRGFVCSSSAVAATLLLVVPMVVAVQNQWSYSLSVEQTQIIQSTSTDQRNIQFGEKVRLLGSRAALSEQGLTIENVWMRTEDSVAFTRYLHVCNAEGKVVGHGKPNLELFQNAKLYEPFTDVISVNNKRLVDADMIGLGFFGDSTMLVVKKGKTSMNKCRLNLISPSQWAMLQQSLDDHVETLPLK